MNTQNAIWRLESLRKSLQAARDTKHNTDSGFVRGLNAGLQLAIEHVEHEIHWAKELETALAKVHQ
jgi:hypothetical protein